MSKLFFTAIAVLIVSALCLLTPVIAQTGGVTITFDAPWDPTIYTSPLTMEIELKKLLSTCPGNTRPTYSRLLGGGDNNVLTPRLFVRTLSTSQDFIDQCIPVLQTQFPNISTIPKNDSACFNDSTNPSQIGFTSGKLGCESPFGAQCSLNTICTSGTSCLQGTCSIVPQVFPIDYKIRLAIGIEEVTPNETLRARNFLAKLKTMSDTALATPECTGQYKVAEWTAVVDATTGIASDTFRLLIASDVKPPQACFTALLKMPATVDGDGAPIPETPDDVVSIVGGNALPTALDKACYTTVTAGFINKLIIGGACNLSRPIGFPCTGETNPNGLQVCPDPNSTCDVYGVPASDGSGTTVYPDLCVLHNAQTYFDNWHVHSVRYESAFTGTDVSVFETHFIAQSQTTDCQADGIQSGSGSITAVKGTIITFDYYFISKNTALSAGCTTILTTVDATAAKLIKTAVYSALDVSGGFPPFSCFLTRRSRGQTPEFNLLRILPGGRCPWKRALGTVCRSQLDCDLTSATQCQFGKDTSLGTICTRPGFIPDATDVKLARIDLEGSAYMGSTFGKQRLAAYVDKLKILCPFNAHLFNIGNGNYSKVNMWLTPFDYDQCTQQMVQNAALQANVVAISSTTTPAGEFNLLDNNDLDFDPLGDNTMGLLNEVTTEPTPEPTPVDPSSIIPKLKWASIKTFTLTLPLECQPTGTTKIECSAHATECTVPCGHGDACISDAHCGSFGKCTSGSCFQRGSAYLAPVKTNNSATISFLIAFAMVLAAVVV